MTGKESPGGMFKQMSFFARTANKAARWLGSQAFLSASWPPEGTSMPPPCCVQLFSQGERNQRGNKAFKWGPDLNRILSSAAASCLLVFTVQ